MSLLSPLERLEPGMLLLAGTQSTVTVSPELAAAFCPGDALSVVERTGEILHIPARELGIARAAVDRAVSAFGALGAATDEAITRFFVTLEARLRDETTWDRIRAVNQRDVESARARGRSTTRLEATSKMRAAMIDGVRQWQTAESPRGRVFERVDHGSWSAELVGAELGVVAFVFEGRPNVVVDATGVLRSGNTVVFRIGGDALPTARAIIELAVTPALTEAGLPEGAVSVVDSTAHAAGWALFGDSRLALAVARGSGRAVNTLGALARAAGVPVSLHGTGGAWLVASRSANPEHLTSVVRDSLDRKVCNTMNTACILASEAKTHVPALLAGLEAAAARLGVAYKLHVAEGSEHAVPAELLSRTVGVTRAEGVVQEKQAELLPKSSLGREWEWEGSPEVTLVLVDSVDEAVRLFNAQSPHFVATLLSEDAAEHERFYAQVDAPFVGDGFTRWVDGQYALGRPELGLSNWEHGRLFGRGGILAGDSVFTVRTRVRGTGRGKPG